MVKVAARIKKLAVVKGWGMKMLARKVLKMKVLARKEVLKKVRAGVKIPPVV